jgi:hypothetical protein
MNQEPRRFFLVERLADFETIESSDTISSGSMIDLELSSATTTTRGYSDRIGMRNRERPPIGQPNRERLEGRPVQCVAHSRDAHRCAPSPALGRGRKCVGLRH